MTKIYKLKRLDYLSSEIFGLDKEYTMILHYLANKKNPEKGASQTEIGRYTERADNKMPRRNAVKRLRGTNRIMGLIPTGYVYEKKEDKHRFKKNESTFHLTFKGMLASLSYGINIRKIYLFKNFNIMILDLVGNKKIAKLIEEYLVSQIRLFLLWHHIAGIQLKKQIENEYYFHEFFKKPDVSDFEFFSQNLSHYLKNDGNKQTNHDKIREIFLDYATSNYIIRILKNQDIIPSSTSFLKWKEVDSDLSIGMIENTDKHKYELHRLLDYWSIFLTDLQNYNLDDLLKNYVYEQPIENEQEDYDKKFKNIVRKKLQSVNARIKFSEIYKTKP